mgnify:CR=1 FL=1
MKNNKKYCNSLTEYSRFKTREVMVGKVGVGGENPIRVQSMTTADTMDTKKSVEETISLVNVGCEIVRLTAPSKKDAENEAKTSRPLGRVQSLLARWRCRSPDDPLLQRL